jgi:hypothetical protein
MQYYGFDWLAMFCGLLGMYLLGSRSKYGFIFCMLGSLNWLVVGIFINSFPLIFGSSIFVILQIRGLISWHKKNY